jgi:hypothetical protein
MMTRSNIQMKRRQKYASTMLLAVALFSTAAFNGCSNRTYDPTYHDYHAWDSNEESSYQRWEAETHRDHQDFPKRTGDEQKEYWTWRHNAH